MDAPLQTEEEQSHTPKLARQALSFLVHSGLALLAWAVLMAIGYLVNPTGVPQVVILGLSLAVPLAAGLIVTKFRGGEMATAVWLLGLIWFLIVALWILDMPTGPNQCFQCGATEKLTRTLFSFPYPSGLIDNDGPFFGTWPAAALVGYSIGASIGLRRRS
ncbi:MAG: hypothetical protein ACLGP3_10330 [Acidobacteriota bacterium]